MHPRTKKHLLRIILPLSRIIAGVGVLLLLATLATLTLIILS